MICSTPHQYIDARQSSSALLSDVFFGDNPASEAAQRASQALAAIAGWRRPVETRCARRFNG